MGDKPLFGVAVFTLLSADVDNLNLLFVTYFPLHEQENTSGYEERKELLPLNLARGTFQDVVLNPAPEPPKVLVIDTDS